MAVYHGYGEATSFQGAVSSACNAFTEVNPFLSCSAVFASGYVTIPPHASGLPLYVLGLTWFPLLALVSVRTGKVGRLNGEILVPLLMVGNVFTHYLWYIELGVVHALCPVCLGMYIVNYAMTGVASKALLGA